jgi:predicted regulator of Ras-like GTPase activity (Roadblock/LC7/MglB family)
MGATLLKLILSEFLNTSGVTTAALVGRDGFVIDVATTASLDRDALGALGSSSINFFENGGTLMESSRLRQMTLEYLNGAIILTPVSREEFLMILTDTTVGIGSLAHRIANTSLRVAAAM